MKLHALDIVGLSLYFLLIAAMGWYYSRRNKSTEEYFLGGRSFPGWAIGISMVGTSISSVTFLAFPADAFKTTWIRFLPPLILPVAVAIVAIYFLPFYRRGRITSAYEYLEKRFGPGIRVYASAAFIIGQLARISIILFLISVVVHEMTGLSPILCIIISGVFVGAYTIIGGIDAVIWTDVLQAVVLALGGIVAISYIINHLPGGLGQIIQVGIEHNKFSFGEMRDGEVESMGWGLSLSRKTGTMMLVMGLFLWLTEYTANQNVVQRYCAAKSIREARKAMIITVCASIPLWGFFMFIGTALFVYFQQFPTPETTGMLTGGRTAEQVFPFFILEVLPPGLSGILIAASLAAAMSSLDSSINAISTVSIVDIYRRHLVKGRGDLHYLRMAFVFATIASIFMIMGAIALALTESQTLQDTATIIGSLVGGGLLGMYLLGFLTRRGDSRSVGVGILATLLFTSWTLFIQFRPDSVPAFLRAPFDLYFTIIIGNILMFAIGYFLSFLLPKRTRDLTNLTLWDQDKSVPLE